MNFDEKLAIQAIKEFNHLVSKGEKALRGLYDENLPPLKAYTKKIIPKHGKAFDGDIEIEYNFHGRGCTIKINSDIIDYDYFGRNFIYEGFGSWKLFKFIKNSGDKYMLLADEEYFFKLIERLEEKDIIRRVRPPYALFQLVEPHTSDLC